VERYPLGFEPGDRTFFLDFFHNFQGTSTRARSVVLRVFGRAHVCRECGGYGLCWSKLYQSKKEIPVHVSQLLPFQLQS
jgi:hypothetical protein